MIERLARPLTMRNSRHGIDRGLEEFPLTAWMMPPRISRSHRRDRGTSWRIRTCSVGLPRKRMFISNSMYRSKEKAVAQCTCTVIEWQTKRSPEGGCRSIREDTLIAQFAKIVLLPTA